MADIVKRFPVSAMTMWANGCSTTSKYAPVLMSTAQQRHICIISGSGYKLLFLHDNHSTQGLAQAHPEALKLASFTNTRKPHDVIQPHHLLHLTILQSRS